MADRLMANLPKRKANRLQKFDYSADGGYFITICTAGMRCILSRVTVGALCDRPPETVISDLGKIVDDEISRLDSVYDCLHVDHYVIMPNHIHMILMIDTASGRSQIAPTISRVVRLFKSAVTKRAGKSIWQNGFHDHVLRDDRDYIMHLQYIDENPEKWLLGKDEYYS